MALVAGNAFVGAGQGEPGGGVVEGRDVVPRTHDMAGFAARPGLYAALGGNSAHALVELALVRIEMARFTSNVAEVVRSHVPAVWKDLVALTAADGSVPALQREAGFAMTLEAEIGRNEAFHRMAVFAAVLVRSGGKLVFVNVFVAVQARRKLDAVLRRFSGRSVTFVAGHGCVFSQQRIGALGVSGNRKGGGLPTFHFVAARTFTLVRAVKELS